jgi:hypothetical protein
MKMCASKRNTTFTHVDVSNDCEVKFKTKYRDEPTAPLVRLIVPKKENYRFYPLIPLKARRSQQPLVAHST